jgi:tRNA-dihydrouridine synthase
MPPTPSPAQRLALAAEQLQALVAERGEHGLLIARKHMGWTCTGFAGAAQLRQQLMRAPSSAEALALLEGAMVQLGAISCSPGNACR